ncbi:hypothetical protein [Streptomyces tateyamensis]|nr:hypothetical protein [Streptomyces tateyamensis]
MADSDLNHQLDPWMFDKSGNLTPQARQQHPDLAGTPAAIGTGGSGSGGGQPLVVTPAALHTAGQNALQLGNRMVADCQIPAGNSMFAAATAMSGWAVGGAITTAHQTWEMQFLTLGGNLITIGQNMQDSAAGYTRTDNANHAHLRGMDF